MFIFYLFISVFQLALNMDNVECLRGLIKGFHRSNYAKAKNLERHLHDFIKFIETNATNEKDLSEFDIYVMAYLVNEINKYKPKEQDQVEPPAFWHSRQGRR